MDNIKELIADLYSARNKLKAVDGNIGERWKFTLDGNLVGDIGEIIACYHFDLIPLGRGEKTHDAKTKDGKYVQIKATQGNDVGLGLEKRDFEYLIVIKIFEDGKYELIYNGPGAMIWENTKTLGISVNKLRTLNTKVDYSFKLKVIRNFI